MNSLNSFETDTKITTLFPMIGGITVLCSFLYLLLGLKSCFNQESVNTKISEEPREAANEKEAEKLSSLKLIFVTIMGIFFFFYVGAEVSYFDYLATFSVKSALGLSPQSGAKITAIFNGSYAVASFLNIFIAIILKPKHVILISCTISCLASLVLSLYGNKYVLTLQIASAFQGFGMAPIYPTGNFMQNLIDRKIL